MNRLKTILLVFSLSVACHIGATNDTIRILCIGNSFSWDAVEQELAPLCEAAGQPVVIGNL